MTEQQEVLADFGSAGVLAGLRWAYLSATTRALEDFSEADGHDAAWLGNTRFTLFRNRLDRVFHCERYAAPEEHSGLDELYARLSGRDIETMPRVAPGVVRRSNLNNSPGWAVGDRRFLLAAGEFGKLDELAWARRSTTKQRVALQREPQPAQPSLFEHLAEEEVGGLFALGARSLDLDTFVVAHSLDPVSRQAELVIGRARLNAGGGPAWAWRADVLRMPVAGASRRTPGAVPVAPDTAPDAPVRLRGRAERAVGGASAAGGAVGGAPGAGASGGGRSRAVRSGAGQFGAGQSAVEQAGVEQAGAGQSRAGRAGAGQAGAVRSGAGRSGGGQRDGRAGRASGER